MRRIAIAGALAGLAAAAGAVFYPPWVASPPSRADGPWGSAADARRHGVALIAAVRAGDAFEGEMLAVNFNPRKGQWVLRGTTRLNDRRVPFFATLARACDAVERLSCWALSGLTVDGRRVALGAAAAMASATPRPEAAAAGMPEAGGDDVAAASPTPSSDPASPGASDAAAKAEDAPARPPQASQSPPQDAAWHVVSSAVTARTGPGTGYAAVFTLSPGVRLHLRETRQGWGLFEYEGEGGTTGRVWVRLDLVEQE